MKNNLMIFERKEQAVVSSRVIAERFDKQHQHVTQAIENLISENSLVKSMFIKSYYETERGRAYKEYLMNYIDAFNKMEAFIQERRSSEWLLTRKQGKLIRRCETDMLANLVEYAESQGSRNMRGKVYTVYSKLINDLVGIQSGQRDSVPFKTISVIAFLEDMVLHTVEEEMKKGTHYKDIYQLCKKNGEQIMRFAYLPKFAEKAS